MDELEHLDRPIRVIGRYALYGRLAAGGMATVHFGRLLGPAGFSRTVAIKRLHPQFAKDPEFVAMFLDEARVAARIQHPNVVATVDVVAMSEELFLVMDYVRGESLSRLLRASRKRGVEVSVPVLASIVVGMLHGLHAAHEAKDEQGRPLSVVHRDVSPQNVLVGVDGVARVLDFGVAKASARVQVTRDGQMKGKLAYMAPEQLKGRGVDRRTDIFAAGIVFWEALTGRRLFDAEEPADVLHMITKEEIPPPSAVVPSLIPVLDALVLKALTRDPSNRYQTAREFAIAVEEAIPVASAREVGEWVERVAGDTLLNRERAVAEIEATSSVSEAGALVPSDVISAPTPRRESAAAQWDEGPTSVFDPASLPADELARTRVQVPRPSVHGEGALRSLAPPKPTSDRPRRPSTPVGAPSPPAPPGAAPAPLDPSRVFDDENETTSVLTSAKGVLLPAPGAATSRPPAAASASDTASTPASPSSVFDDEQETTSVYDPSAAGKLRSSMPVGERAAPTLPRSTLPPKRSAEERGGAARTAPPTVIVQEEALPAGLFRDPASTLVRKVAIAATLSGVLLGLVLVTAGRRANPGEAAAGGHPVAAATGALMDQEPRSTPTVPLASAAAESPSAGAEPGAAPVPEPGAEQEGPSPSGPRAADPVPQRPASRPLQVERGAAPAGRSRSQAGAPAVAPPDGDETRSAAPSPAAPSVPREDLLVNPYAEDVPKAAPATPAAPRSQAPAAPGVAAKDCKRPYYLDGDGIRRVKPECL